MLCNTKCKTSKKDSCTTIFLISFPKTFMKQTRESQIQNLQRKIVTLGLLCMEFITEVVFSVRKDLSLERGSWDKSQVWMIDSIFLRRVENHISVIKYTLFFDKLILNFSYFIIRWWPGFTENICPISSWSGFLKGDGKLHFEDIKLESYSAKSASPPDVQKPDNKTKNIPEYNLNSNISPSIRIF